MKRRILCIVLVALLLLPFLLFLTGCTEADNVNHNLSQAADNFQCLRKITVYNARTDLIVMEMEGCSNYDNGMCVIDRKDCAGSYCPAWKERYEWQ